MPKATAAFVSPRAGWSEQGDVIRNRCVCRDPQGLQVDGLFQWSHARSVGGDKSAGRCADNGHTVMYIITDGGLCDENLTAIGVITDPSGVAVPGVMAGDTSSPTPNAVTATSPSGGGGSVDPLNLGMLFIISLLARMHLHRACVYPARPLTEGCRKSHGLRGHHPDAYVTIRPCIQL